MVYRKKKCFPNVLKQVKTSLPQRFIGLVDWNIIDTIPSSFESNNSKMVPDTYEGSRTR